MIVDFDAYVKKHFGRSVEEFSRKSDFWNKVQGHNDKVEPFFLSMDKTPDADELLDFVFAHFENVKILTASGYTPKDGKQQKIDWYDAQYPTLECIVVNKSPDKAVYALEGDVPAVLIDDRKKSIDPWEAAGGVGVLHTSAKNTIDQLKYIFKID